MRDGQALIPTFFYPRPHSASSHVPRSLLFFFLPILCSLAHAAAIQLVARFSLSIHSLENHGAPTFKPTPRRSAAWPGAWDVETRRSYQAAPPSLPLLASCSTGPRPVALSPDHSSSITSATSRATPVPSLSSPAQASTKDDIQYSNQLSLALFWHCAILYVTSVDAYV